MHAMGRMATGNDTRLRRGVPAHTWACQQHTSALQPPLPRPALPQVALVGYTNAGKSSLMAAVAKHSGVAAEDRLFATLDPTLRCAGLHAGLAQHAGAGAAGVGLKQPAQSSSCWAPSPARRRRRCCRRVRLPGAGRDVILSDTVGFISDLPHQLVEAFKVGPKSFWTGLRVRVCDVGFFKHSSDSRPGVSGTAGFRP